MKPRIRVKVHNFAQCVFVLGSGVPDDARPGDLVVGNRGAAAEVRADEHLRVLYLQYVGNYVMDPRLLIPGAKLHDFR